MTETDDWANVEPIEPSADPLWRGILWGVVFAAVALTVVFVAALFVIGGVL